MRLVLLAVALLASSSLACASAAPLPPKAVALNEDGAAALAAGDLQIAEARLSLAIEYNPRFTEAWVNLGLVALERGFLDVAEKRFSTARSLNADLPTPHHGLALLAEKREDGALAEKHYRAALKVDPGFGPARANLARLLFARARYDEAHGQFLRLTEVSPETQQGWVGLAECALRLGRDVEADEVLSRARAGFGDTPELMVLVARQLLRRSAYADAENVLAPVTGASDRARAGVAWAWTAVARLGRGDVEGAARAASEALAIDRADAVAAYAMGVALTARGDAAAARPFLARASSPEVEAHLRRAGLAAR
jgi:Tfp pilus assembly protein PilF